MIKQVPELSDGGYWYVVPTRRDSLGVLSADVAAEHCAWYASQHAVVRCQADAAPIPTQGIAVASVLNSSAKPYGRIRGR